MLKIITIAVIIVMMKTMRTLLCWPYNDDDENDQNKPWYAGHRWRGWREHQNSLPKQICHRHDENTLRIMMMTMMMMIKMMITWGVEGDEGRHSSAGSIAASPSLTI